MQESPRRPSSRLTASVDSPTESARGEIRARGRGWRKKVTAAARTRGDGSSPKYQVLGVIRVAGARQSEALRPEPCCSWATSRTDSFLLHGESRLTLRVIVENSNRDAYT